MWVVSVGDCFNGLSFYGPFEGYEEAQDWADSSCKGLIWQLVSLIKPRKPSGGIRVT